jgi:hypothetical protein
MSGLRLGLGLARAHRGAYGEWPLPGWLLDLDFINRRYFWGDEEKGEADFTTFTLNGSTFGPNGLTPTATVDITLATSAFGFVIPGTLVAQVFPTSDPAAGRSAVVVHNGGANNEFRFQQQATTGSLGFIVNTGGTAVASIIVGRMLNARNGLAASFGTDDVKAAVNGVAGTADPSAVMPAVTTAQFGKRFTASTEFLGAISRVLFRAGASTQDQLNALS